MKTEQEIRTEAIKEAMSAVKSLKVKRDTWTYPEKADVHNFAVDDCLEELKDLLPTLPSSPAVSDERLDSMINLFSLEAEVRIKNPALAEYLRVFEDYKHLRTAKAEPCVDQHELKIHKGDTCEITSWGIEGVCYWSDNIGQIANFNLTEKREEGMFICNVPFSDLRLVKSAEPEKAVPSLVDKIKARIESNLKDPSETDYEKGWDDGQKQILSMISEAQNGN